MELVRRVAVRGVGRDGPVLSPPSQPGVPTPDRAEGKEGSTKKLEPSIPQAVKTLKSLTLN